MCCKFDLFGLHQGTQPLQHIVALKLLPLLMPDRHIPPLALFIRERQPHKLRKHRRLRCRLRVERDNLRRLKRTEHRVQRSLRIYHDVFGGRSLVRSHIQHPQLLAPCATHTI